MNLMINEINSLPSLIEEKINYIDQNIRGQLSHNDIMSIKKVVITGCGDSFFAGLAAKHFFQNICDIPTVAQESMETSTYELIYKKTDFPFPKNPLVLAISVSGQVARTVEAVISAKKIGAWTIAFTGNKDSRLAKESENIIDCSIPALEEGQVPGVRSYRISLLALYLFALHFAEVNRTISMQEADRYRSILKDTSSKIEQTIKANNDIAKELAEKYKNDNYFVFVGDGPCYASAKFGAAKIIESAGKSALPQYTEEWAHLQYFESAIPNAPTFVIPSKFGLNRSIELFEPMKRVGRPLIVIANSDNKEINKWADYVMPVPPEINPYFAPMVNTVGCELFAAHLADAVGTKFFRRDIDAYLSGNNTIVDSKINE